MMDEKEILGGLTLSERVSESSRGSFSPSARFWWEDPVLFEDFIAETSGGRNFLSPAKIEVAHRILQVEDPKDYWDTSKRIVRKAVIRCGKGGGKGTLGSCLEAYVFYLLMCLRDPFSYFGIGREDGLDLVNVATNAKQAEEKFFSRVMQRIKTHPWFLDNFRIVDHGKVRSSGGPNRRGDFSIAQRYAVMETLNGGIIRLSSLSSENEGWEGGNILFSAFDEVSGFASDVGLIRARKIYRSLITSDRNLPDLHLALSYVRMDEERDMIVQLYREARKSEDAVAIWTTPWDFQHEGAYGELEEVVIPVDLEPSESDPFPDFIERVEGGLRVRMPKSIIRKVESGDLSWTDVLSIYFCLPVGYIEGFMGGFSVAELADLVDERDHLFITEPFTESSGNRTLIGKSIVGTTRPPVRADYVVAMDAGAKHSDAAVVVGHLIEVEAGNPIVVVDDVLVWRPSAEHNVAVSVDNLVDVIVQIAGTLDHVSLVRIDHWQGPYFQEALERHNLKVVLKNASLNEYLTMRHQVKSGLVRLPNIPEVQLLRQQLNSLGPAVGASKPKPLGGGKMDVADAFTELVATLLSGHLPVVIDADAVRKIEHLGGVPSGGGERRDLEEFFGLRPGRGLASKSSKEFPLGGVVRGGSSRRSSRRTRKRRHP